VIRLLLALFIVSASPGQITLSADAPPVAAAAAKPDTGKSEVTFQKDILPFISQHCFHCHGNGKAKADLTLDRFKDDLSLQSERKVWENVLHMLQMREMPPKERAQPSQSEMDQVVKAIDGVLAKLDCGSGINVGRVTIRRLNKTEYNNTIRDLLGVDFKPADDFPADDVGYGFDNIGDVLSVSPLLLEKYLSAAESILDQAILIFDPPKPSRSAVNINNNNRATTLTTRGEIGGTISFDEGDYKIRARVIAEQAGDEPVKVALRVARLDVKEFEIKASGIAPTTIETTVRMKPGTRQIGVAFLNPYTPPPPPVVTRPAEGVVKSEDASPKADAPAVAAPKPRSVALARSGGLEVEGPFNPPPPNYPPVHTRLMAHQDGLKPRAAAQEIVSRFASKAFRRPALPDEVEKCLALYDTAQAQGQRFENCVRAALYRVLVSPYFLFRIELDPPGVKAGTPYPVSEYELASRLSYFLWNSLPDDALLALAEKSQLRQNLGAQVRRMIQDPKASSFLQSFSDQWLTLRKLDLASPDPKMFPTFDKNLRQAMLRESTLFFEAIAREDRSVLELLDADFTFVNEPLAKHYGIEGVQGREFVRVKLPSNRVGILTQASVLALTSNATRTSPVKRGKFVLEQIFNTPPPPPPDNVPLLEEGRQLTGTLRQIMEQHRENAACASCHQRMDPLGFAFENFDAIGAWRDKDSGGFAIDASGVLPSGRSFVGAQGLKAVLRDQKDLFVRCLSEKMLTYALGRGLEFYDRCAVNKIMETMEKKEYRFSSLVLEIVQSDPFQMRTATGETQ
jgi:mono/diheme cytochrome c family protein